MAIVPIQRRGERIGAVTVASVEPRTFTPLELERVEAMADLLSVSLANAELFETHAAGGVALSHAVPRGAGRGAHGAAGTGRIREANDAVRDVFGLGAASGGRTHARRLLVARGSTARLEQALGATLRRRAGAARGAYHRRRRHARASSRWRRAGCREADPPSALLVGRDMTHEREMRVRLMESDRLAAVGELVAGVAHEVNNPLSSISAFAQLLLRDGGLTAAAARLASR